jgi:predicted NAD/FAD-binding protein
MNVAVLKQARAQRRIAVIGSGISGASCAWALSGSADVVVFEAEARAGGHTATVDIDYDGRHIAVDTGFIVYNEHNYTELTQLFALLGVATHASDMSFALSLDEGRLEWSGQNLATIFAQKRNVLSPSFLLMLREILRFNRICVDDRDGGRLAGMSIGDYLVARRFSPGFRDNYLLPMAAAIWSTPRVQILDFPASTFVTFFDNHRLIRQERPTWRTVSGGSRNYLDKLLAPLAGGVRLGAPVEAVTRDALGASVRAGGRTERFDAVVIAAHSDQALAMLADPSTVETNILSAVSYRPNRVVLHRDPRLMPQRRAAWSSWNYLRSSGESDDADVCVTYWMNRLQGIDERMPLFVSLNPSIEPREELVFGEWSFEHPQFDAAAISAQSRLDEVQGVRNTWYAGAWTGYGFHEDGLRSGLDAAQALGARIPWRSNAPLIEELPLAAE